MPPFMHVTFAQSSISARTQTYECNLNKQLLLERRYTRDSHFETVTTAACLANGLLRGRIDSYRVVNPNIAALRTFFHINI